MSTRIGMLGLVVVVLVSLGSPAFAGFIDNQIFLSSSRTDEVRIYDADSLVFQSSFTHSLFTPAGSPDFAYGPNGMAFNHRGNLVVAARTAFVEFSSPGVEYATYGKATDEATENVLFDALGNLYTTTSTGGSNLLNQYRASDYAFVQSIALPSGSGQLTGITFGPDRTLYVASQTGAKIIKLQADPTFTTFTHLTTFASGNSSNLEGLQFNQNGELIAAGGNITRYNPVTGAVLGSFDASNDAFPVPVTVDNLGRIFVADFEDGHGGASADIFRFTPDGTSFVSVHDPALYGPFGLAISGTSLPGGPPGPSSVPLPGAAWTGLALLAGIGFLRRLRRRPCPTTA